MFSERSLVFRLFGFSIPMFCLLALQACAVHPAEHPFTALDTTVTALSADCVQITVVDTEACHDLSWWSEGAGSACADRDEMLTTIQTTGSCPGGLTFPAVEMTCCTENSPEPPGPITNPHIFKGFGDGSSFPIPGLPAEEDPDDEEESAPDNTESFFNPPKK